MKYLNHKLIIALFLPLVLTGCFSSSDGKNTNSEQIYNPSTEYEAVVHEYSQNIRSIFESLQNISQDQGAESSITELAQLQKELLDITVPGRYKEAHMKIFLILNTMAHSAAIEDITLQQWDNLEDSLEVLQEQLTL